MMHGNAEPLLARLEHLLQLVSALDLPLLATFEEPETKGWLPDRLEVKFPNRASRFTKRTYDCCSEPSILEGIRTLNVRQLAVAGSETDVCVLQSVLSLLRLGWEVFLLEDCLFSSEARPGPALARMQQAGAIPSTYKALYYEIKRSVDRDLFAGSSGRPRVEPTGLPASIFDAQ